MNLNKPLLEELFNKQIRFIIPVFQRHYVWTEQEQLQPLWDDFLNKYRERINKQKIHPHYTGSIVLYHENTTTSTLSTYIVIDGQQRLTSFQIFITAFREVCRKRLGDESLIGELNKLLFNEKSYGDENYEIQKFKLEPTKFNKEIFQTIVSNSYDDVDRLLIQPFLQQSGVGYKTYRQKAKNSNRLLGAYLFFFDRINEFIDEEDADLEEIIKQFLWVLKRDFQFVEIGLLQQDDPQMIFETMNGRGAKLTETDLIRNYIFMRANSNQENLDKIYEDYWDEFDDPSSEFKWHAQTSRGRYYESHLQFFMIDYLTIKLMSDVRYDQVFYHYKSFIINNSYFDSVKDELKELNKYSQIYKRLSAPKSINSFDKLANRLIDMGISTVNPLILYVEGDDQISIENKNKIYQYLDSYLTRRLLCGYTIKNYNKVFIDYLKFLTQHKDAEEFKQMLLEKTSDTNVWPRDNILQEKILSRPIYIDEKSRSIVNILLEIEIATRGSKQEKVTFINDGLTIEHLLPQNWFENWPLDDGFITEEDFNIAIHAVMTESEENGKYHKIVNRNRMLHTLGNLTILTNALNPSVSNSSYDIKKQEIIKQSTLLLNSYFMDRNTWDENEISIRGKYLYNHIKNIWSI